MVLNTIRRKNENDVDEFLRKLNLSKDPHFFVDDTLLLNYGK
jgi:hypothetical protein